MFSYECLRVSLDIFDIRTVFGFWSFLFPDTNLSWPLNDSTEFSVLTTISNDTSNSVRISALNFMFNFFDYSKQYVQILVQDSTTTSTISGGKSSSSFTPISVSLATMIKELHRFFHYILLKENNCSILILLYKILSLIISITPYHKLSDDEILNQLFNQNCYMIDNKVTQIKNLSLALYVKIFSLSTIPPGLESWIFETESGRITMNKIFKHCYEFIDNQDYILLIIESIKLFISILRHYKFARKLLSKKCIEKFNVEMFFMKISFKIIEMDKAYNNSVLQTLMCKFIHTIGLFFKDLSSTTFDEEDDYKIFANLDEQENFIKQWYLKIISTKIFHLALKEQNPLIIQNSSQITLINVISIIPENIFKLFNENIHFEIISILISLAKIDNHHITMMILTTNNKILIMKKQIFGSIQNQHQFVV
ncbi:HEAT repeat-containing protein 6 [Dermatophagoides pteronyssinus]|uniref:HEAT repeat-containing protein 6 n=1 Tax=Dermatophagoides pteronyssinus TaxID=6956 RepID=A0ABQ8J6N5_DERPT|nr:HEAT repeat-containing protein 6 [Dermatophagoides pteronyssinus]